MDEPPDKKRRIVQDDGAENVEERPYVVERVRETRAHRYNVEEITFRARFNDDLKGRDLLDITDDLHGMFQEIMEKVENEHSRDDDRARLSIKHAGLDREIFIHCQPKHNITADAIMERLVLFLSLKYNQLLLKYNSEKQKYEYVMIFYFTFLFLF